MIACIVLVTFRESKTNTFAVAILCFYVVYLVLPYTSYTNFQRLRCPVPYTNDLDVLCMPGTGYSTPVSVPVHVLNHHQQQREQQQHPHAHLSSTTLSNSLWYSRRQRPGPAEGRLRDHQHQTVTAAPPPLRDTDVTLIAGFVRAAGEVGLPALYMYLVLNSAVRMVASGNPRGPVHAYGLFRTQAAGGISGFSSSGRSTQTTPSRRVACLCFLLFVFFSFYFSFALLFLLWRRTWSGFCSARR